MILWLSLAWLAGVACGLAVALAYGAVVSGALEDEERARLEARLRDGGPWQE